jgi:beta-galactosidase
MLPFRLLDVSTFRRLGVWLAAGAAVNLATVAVCAEGVTAEVKPQPDGSVLLFIDGRPRTPLMFFGWAGGPGPTVVHLTPEWRQYHTSFIAPEDNAGNCGVHIRVGNEAGTVWIDDAEFYGGPHRAKPGTNLLRCGDWDADRKTVGDAWVLFVKQDAGAKADWQVDTAAPHGGRQCCKVTVEHAGQSTMHVHFFQTGLTVQRGQRYTFSVWMKADRNRLADIQVLHHGPPWRIYSGREDSPLPHQVRLAAAAGIHMHSIGIDMPWPRPGQPNDFSDVDDKMDQVLRADPQALILPRFGVAPPEWWYDQHPDDAMQFDDGRRRLISVASPDWRTAMVEQVRQLVAHCEQKYGRHIFGYHPCAQHTGEWFYERSWEGRHAGFCPTMKRGFANWLRQRYGTVEALRKAWSQPDASFEKIDVPSVRHRNSATVGVFRDPVRERWIVDFYEYQQVAMVEPMEMLARAIKEQTARRKLVVLFYGYYFEISGLPQGPKASGHLALGRLLQCPEVDIVCSPISYSDRQPGGMGAFMSPVDSVRAHGKLWLNEDDTRTYLTLPEDGYGRAETPQLTYWVHHRNFGQLLPRRLACWYMDLGGTGWLAGKDIWDQIAPLRQIYDEQLSAAARWSPEVALVVDETGPLYLGQSPNIMSRLANEMRLQFYRMGAPFGIYLLSDLTAGKVPPAKACLFVGCFRLTPQDRQAVKRVMQDRTAVWFYGSGFLSDRASTEQMSDLVGMRLRELTDRPNSMVTIDPSGGTLTTGLAGARFGIDERLTPLWAVEEAPGVDAIGRFSDRQIAAACVKAGTGRSIYIGTVTAPSGLLRNLLKAAGVHAYIDTPDVLLTDGQFLSLTASQAGHKTIRLPSQRRVTQLPARSEVARSTDRIEADLAQGETRMYWLGEP